MSMLRIVAAFREENFREEVPSILYVGYDADAARSASDLAPAEFHRIELIESRGGRRLRKNTRNLSSSPIAAVPVETPDKTGAAASSEESSDSTPALDAGPEDVDGDDLP